MDGAGATTIGNIDVLNAFQVSGWVRARQGRRATIDLYIDRTLVSQCVAEIFRRDLLAAEIGDGYCGFTFAVPALFRDGRAHAIQVLADGEPMLEVAAGIKFVNEQFGVPAAINDLNVYANNRLLPDRSHKGIALFAIHNRHGRLTLSQQAMLFHVKKAGFRTVIINSFDEISCSMRDRMLSLSDALITRPDYGRDFASWLLAYGELEQKILRYNMILFCNDSFSGPFAGVSSLIEQFKESKASFWAPTDSWEQSYHLQTSFFLVDQEVIRSNLIDKFSSSYSYSNVKDDVIKGGEIGLSRFFIENGVSHGVHVGYEDLCRQWMSSLESRLSRIDEFVEYKHIGNAELPGMNQGGMGHRGYARTWYTNLASDIRECRPRNTQHVFAELMLENGIPFLKRELLAKNPAGVPELHRLKATAVELFGAGAAGVIDDDLRVVGGMAPGF